MIKYFFLLIIVSLFFTAAGVAQAPCIKWQKTYGGSLADGDDGDYQDIYNYSVSVIQTKDGGYMSANYTQSADGDVTGNHGYGDVWLIKTDAAGTLQWQKTFGGSNYDRAFDLEQTTDGGYIFTGFTQSSDGDVSAYHGGRDWWVVKIDVAGNIQWEKTYGGSDADIAYDIEQTADGGYIIGGDSRSNDGDLPANKGDEDCWLVKINSTGTIVWQTSVGGSMSDRANSVKQTTDGGYIVSGGSWSADGDLPGNRGDDDLLVFKLNSAGNLQWLKTFGGSKEDYGYDVIQSSDGGYAVAGHSVSPDGNLVSPNWGVLLKLDAGGNISWLYTPSGLSNIIISGDIHQTADGHFIMASYGEDVHGSLDIFITKISSSGVFLWNKTLGGSGLEDAGTVKQTADGGYIVAGTTRSADGDVTVNKGSNDVWLVKLDTVATPDVTITQPSCTVSSGSISVVNPMGANFLYSINGSSYQSTVLFSSLAAGTYPVTAKNTDIGCTSIAKIIVIKTPPAAPATPVAFVTTQPSCTTTTGTITITAPLQPAYLYSTNGTSYSSALLYAGLVPGTYNITIKDTTSSCISQPLQLLITNSLNTATAPAVVADSVCGRGTVQLTATGTGSLQWFSDVLLSHKVAAGNTFTPVIESTTTYYVIDSLSPVCISSASTVTGFVNPLPPKPYLGIDTVVCPGNVLLLHPGNFEQYLWQDGSTAPQLQITEPGLYYVTVTSAAGCTNADSVDVKVNTACNDVWFPNAITADGNTRNSLFGALGNVAAIKNYSLRIYNRFGQLVFETADPYARWDGNFKKSRIAVNNFVWHAAYEYKGVIRNRKGNILVIR